MASVKPATAGIEVRRLIVKAVPPRRATRTGRNGEAALTTPIAIESERVEAGFVRQLSRFATVSVAPDPRAAEIRDEVAEAASPEGLPRACCSPPMGQRHSKLRLRRYALGKSSR